MIPFDPPLVKARLIKRYKRFLSDHYLEDGRLITASCPNTGAMIGAKDEGMTTYLRYDPRKGKTYDYSWQLVECDGVLTAINTHLPNKLVRSALTQGLIRELTGYDLIKAEQPYHNNSRIDFLLQSSAASRPDCYVEIKAVHMSRSKALAEFPDAVTARGAKHLEALMAQVAQGYRAVLLFIIQRPDCEALCIAKDIDPNYAQLIAQAKHKGVEILAYDSRLSPQAAEIQKAVPFILNEF